MENGWKINLDFMCLLKGVYTRKHWLRGLCKRRRLKLSLSHLKIYDCSLQAFYVHMLFIEGNLQGGVDFMKDN